MQLNVKINMDNAAFEGYENLTNEVKRIFDVIHRQLCDGDNVRTIQNVNGNVCGKWSLTVGDCTERGDDAK